MSEYARRNEILIELGFRDYKQYLRSSVWTDIRKRKLAKDPLCYGCGKQARQVHHSKYTLEMLVGSTLTGLYSVCKLCHLNIEFTPDGRKRNPKQATDELIRIHRRRLFGGHQTKIYDRTRVLRSLRNIRAKARRSFWRITR